MKEILVKPLGLVSRPNEYGQFPIGALLTAQNMVMRSPGIIESAPALVLGVSFGASGNIVHDLFPLDNNKMSNISVAGGTWTPRVDTTSSTFTTPLAAPAFSGNGRISTVRSRGRVLFNTTDKGVIVMDSTSPTPPAALRIAGLPAPCTGGGSFTTTNARALPNNSCAGYAAVVRRIFSDGYEIVSKPSPVFVMNSFGVGSAIDPSITVTSSSTKGYAAGDIIELYRTNVITATSVNTDPGSTCKKLYSRILSSGDVASFSVSFTDTSAPGPLGVTDGEELYTNPGQKGLAGGHRQPDIAQGMAVFKNYTFLGDITERPQLKFQIPGGIIDTIVTGYDTVAFRTYGLGLRRCDGTVTLGSANITGVSATHMLGVVQGQEYVNGIGGATFPGGTTVASAAGTTITMSANATAGGTGVRLSDVLEINGTRILFTNNSGARGLLSSVQSFLTTSNSVEATLSGNALFLEDPTIGVTDLTWILEPYRPNTAANFTVRATNGQNYQPALTEITLTAATLPYVRTRNLHKWSNDSQPEHFPGPNETQIGLGDFIAYESTRDALWFSNTDGLYRLSGDGGQWRVDTADTTLVLASPRASCVLKEAVYAYTNQGLVRVTDAGTENLSELIVGDILPGAEYSETASIIVERNEQDDEIVIRIDATQVYVYSVREQTFTTVLMTDVTAMTYARYPVSGLPALAVGQSPSGSAPSYSLWNSTSSFLAPTARFHPIYDQDPFVSKQWIEGVWIFDSASAGKSITPAWNGTTSTASLLKGGGRYFNECRAVFGVPRRAATGMTLAPGFSFGALSTATKMFALSARFNNLSDLNLHR